MGVHVYEVHLRKDKRGVDPVSYVPSFGFGTKSPRCGRLREIFSRSHDAVIRVYDDAGNVIETHEHADQFKE